MRSTMQTLSRRIVEYRIGHAHIGPLIGEGEERVQYLALAGHAPGKEAEPDRIAERRAVADRGDAADHRHRRRDARIDNDLRSRAQPRATIHGNETDETVTLGLGESRARQSAPADEIGLLGAHQPAKAEILGRRIAV